MSLPYIEPVFRPPSEADSLILQVTNGCSWNRCTYCEMYTAPQKKFTTRPQAELQAEIDWAAQRMPWVRRVFLADGDAMVLSSRRLLALLASVRSAFPDLNRISAYCLPRNLRNKTVDELVRMRELGLSLLYVGAESGDDEVLRRVDKGETLASTAEALEKIHAAGIRASVMLLNGLGGRHFSRQHAENSARLVNRTQPAYLATLVVSFPMGEDRFRESFGPDYEPLDQAGLFREMAWLLEASDLQRTVFRSDHASNYLVLKGVLGRDKPRLLEQVKAALSDPASARLRPEWARGL